MQKFLINKNRYTENFYIQKTFIIKKYEQIFAKCFHNFEYLCYLLLELKDC